MKFNLIFICSNIVGDPSITVQEAQRIGVIVEEQGFRNPALWTCGSSEAGLIQQSLPKTSGTQAIYPQLCLIDRANGLPDIQWFIETLNEFEKHHEKQELIIIGHTTFGIWLMGYHMLNMPYAYPLDVIIFEGGDVKTIAYERETSPL